MSGSPVVWNSPVAGDQMNFGRFVGLGYTLHLAIKTISLLNSGLDCPQGQLTQCRHNGFHEMKEK